MSKCKILRLWDSRMELRAFCVILLITILAVSSQAAKNKKEKGKKGASDCTEWTWGSCIPNSKDCGAGTREGTCKEETRKLKCKIPCNWKKDFGADCKYKFENWGECNATTGQKVRSGTLKKALYNADCQQTVEAAKPCSLKTKSKSKGKKGKGKE
ncbi:midkine-B isoform X1 [Xenopus laevis]|nr:midkine-B isoform X1 [Xenopus laevis]